jgi:hypothetical protein
MLAQILSSPPAVLTGACIIILLAGALGFSQLRKFRSEFADEIRREIAAATAAQSVAVQQPLIVKSEARLATHEELRGVESRVERLERQDAERLQMVTKALNTLDEKNEERASKTHERINLLLGAVSEMRGEIKRLPCSPSKPCQT